MKRYVFMKLRVANKDDFADESDRKRIGAIYFQQSATGAMEKQPHYFTEATDLNKFKELYVMNQIYVPVGIFDEVEIVEEKEETITQ